MGLTECSNMNIMQSSLSLINDNVLCNGSILAASTSIDYNCHYPTNDYWMNSDSATTLFPNPMKQIEGKGSLKILYFSNICFIVAIFSKFFMFL